MSYTIIALTGPKTVGKSTIAHALADIINTDGARTEARIYSFAQPMRDMLHALGVPAAAFSATEKEKPIDWIRASPRDLMLTLGTDWGRGCVGDHIWINALENKIRADAAIICPEHSHGAPGEHLVAIIDDCRFPNEAAWVQRSGGSIMRLERPGIVYLSDHATETPLPVQYLDGTLDATNVDVCASCIYALTL